MEPARKKGIFKYSDYLTWPDAERWELIGGEAWAMSPSPSVCHQRISLNMARTLGGYLRGKACHAYAAPLDVVLSDLDVVQPDLLVVCDPSKIKTTHIAGAPDLVIEILSPSTAAKDRKDKFNLYEKYGVREYLVIHPEENYMEQFLLEADGRFGMPNVISSGEVYKSFVLDGLEIDLKEIFE